MKNSLLILLAFTLAASAPAFAFSVSDKCGELQSCAKAFSEILGENYLYDVEFRGKVESSPKFEVTRENAEEVFTHILYLAGFARVPLKQPKTFSIMRQRDARDSALPIIEGSQKSEPTFPRNWDLVTFKYKVTHPESAEPMARGLRSMLPANARIIPNELSGTVLITDAIPNVQKCFNFLKEWDVKPSAEMKRIWEKREREANARNAK